MREWGEGFRSTQAGAEALDSAARLVKLLHRGGVGDAEVGRQPERRPMHDSDTLVFEERRHHVLVVLQRLAGGVFLPINPRQEG